MYISVIIIFFLIFSFFLFTLMHRGSKFYLLIIITHIAILKTKKKLL